MNAVANRMTPSITTMIRIDHSHVLALFHRYKADTSVNRKRALVTNACLALQVHTQLEEEIFYPALREVMSGDEVLDKSVPEHNEIRRLIDELRQAGDGGDGGSRVGDQNYDEKFFQLIRVVIHHVADEETHLLPAAERLLSDKLGQLGMQMARRRVELMRPHAGELAATTVRSFPTGAALLTAGAVAVGAMLLSRGRRGGEERRPPRW